MTDDERREIINKWLAWLPTLEDEAAYLEWLDPTT